MSENLNEETYRELKREVDYAKSEADRAKGGLDTLMTRLINDFGCETIAEGEKSLKKLQSQLEEEEEAFEKALTAYKKKWRAKEEEDK